jgi:hypothetical protein
MEKLLNEKAKSAAIQRLLRKLNKAVLASIREGEPVVAEKEETTDGNKAG